MWNRINICKFHYGTIMEGEDGTFTRSKPKYIANITKAAVNPKIATGTLYGEGVLRENATKLTGAEIAIELNKLPTEDEKIILGKTKDTNGILHDNIKDQPISIYVGWEVELSGGGSEFIYFTNCIAKANSKEVQQSTDNINFSTDTLLITAMADENGDVRLFGETIDKEFKCGDTWFDSCPPKPKA